jgi:RNA polymerase sigma factor (sigma-70 family)
MSHDRVAADSLHARIGICLERLAAGDLRARDELLEVCVERLRIIASRVLLGFPKVRRWNDTGDILQGVLMRLHQSLATVRPASPRDLLALATSHMHHELIDLARRYAGPRSHAFHHDTNSLRSGDQRQYTDMVAARERDDDLDRWEAFHMAVEQLPGEEQEVFRLVWYFGCDQGQVAAAMGCSTRTVKRHWQAARESIVAAVGDRPPT